MKFEFYGFEKELFLRCFQIHLLSQLLPTLFQHHLHPVHNEKSWQACRAIAIDKHYIVARLHLGLSFEQHQD